MTANRCADDSPRMLTVAAKAGGGGQKPLGEGLPVCPSPVGFFRDVAARPEVRCHCAGELGVRWWL